MSEQFLEREKNLKKAISLEDDGNSIKIIEVDEYIMSILKKFQKTAEQITNEYEAKVLFLDYIEIKNNIDGVYMPNREMDEYTIGKMDFAYDTLAKMYANILVKSPTIYTSQIQYLLYNTLYNDADQFMFFKYLIDAVKFNFSASRYLIGVFKEIIFVHYDLDINNAIKENITEYIDLLKNLCNNVGLDVKEELEGLID